MGISGSCQRGRLRAVSGQRGAEPSLPPWPSPARREHPVIVLPRGRRVPAQLGEGPRAPRGCSRAGPCGVACPALPARPVAATSCFEDSVSFSHCQDPAVIYGLGGRSPFPPPWLPQGPVETQGREAPWPWSCPSFAAVYGALSCGGWTGRGCPGWGNGGSQ